MANYNTIYENGMYRWPDMYLNSEEYYSVDCGPYLEAEDDVIEAVAWVVPPGLAATDYFVIDNEAYVKIKAEATGSHTVQFKLLSVESDRVQTVQELIKIVVIDI